MKKRLTVAILLIFTLVIAMGALVGCDEIFKKNDERDAKQIVATVTYNNQTANVTKGELTASFNNYAYYYVNYYGLTYEQAANYIVRSLAQRELLVLFAKEYVLNEYIKMGKLPEGSVPELTTLRSLLTTSEYAKAIEDTNNDMLTSLTGIIEGLVTDDRYNAGTTEPKDEEVEVTDPVRVRFNSLGGSNVDTQKIQTGTKADEPTDPTYTNFTFYGWFTQDGSSSGEWGEKFDFDTTVSSDITLYAKWVTYLAPRAERPEEEEVDDYDADLDDANAVEPDKFFSDAYIAKLKNKEIELTSEIEIDDADYESYIDEGIATLRRNIESNFNDYDYYLNSEMKTLLISKLERYVGNLVSVTDSDVQDRFNRLVEQNKETFVDSDTSFSSALTSALATTYFHKFTVDENNSGYGFVVNILLRLSDEDTEYLKNLVSSGNVSAEIITEIRNQRLNAMMIDVSNPAYDADAEIDYNGDAEDVEIIDPMTDVNNPYNDYGTAGKGTKVPDTTYQNEGGNQYNKLVTFGKNENGEWAITFNATECPTMAYLMEQVPAFSVGETVGIIDQIYNSFNEVKDFVDRGELTHIEGVYWLRQVATTWVYLVGDDPGMTSTDSNNGGLGYLVTPESEDTSYLESFTDMARGIIKNGTGSFSVNGTMSENNFYTFGDSFINSGTVNETSYAGIFVLLCSYKTWDENSYVIVENEDGSYSEEKISEMTKNADGSGTLPLDYIITYGKTLSDCVSVGQQVRTDLETGMKSDRYNLVANEFGIANTPNIVYNEKVYKSLWKDLD